jgi:hypothetical protein
MTTADLLPFPENGSLSAARLAAAVLRRWPSAPQSRVPRPFVPDAESNGQVHSQEQGAEVGEGNQKCSHSKANKAEAVHGTNATPDRFEINRSIRRSHAPAPRVVESRSPSLEAFRNIDPIGSHVTPDAGLTAGKELEGKTTLSR